MVRWPSETDLAGKPPESLVNVLVKQLAATLRDEEERAGSPGWIFITPCRVIAHHVPRRGMQWHQARLAELRIADGENALLQIGIFAP
jgi:hypothetical protein